MKEQLQRELRRRELDKQTQTWIEELRKKAYIDIKLPVSRLGMRSRPLR